MFLSLSFSLPSLVLKKKRKKRIKSQWFLRNSSLEDIENISPRNTLRYLKNSVRDWLRVVASDKETFKLGYLPISQDEDGSQSEDQGKPPFSGFAYL